MHILAYNLIQDAQKLGTLFMNVEVDSEQLSNLPNITQQIHGRR
jgi:hypothetical protein